MENTLVKATFTCGRCFMLYYQYKHLLEHLYWRHGTESFWCNLCCLKRWSYAVHICHVLPINCDDSVANNEMNAEDSSRYKERETDFCYCGKFIADSLMIGCDGPNCNLQWFHLTCVGMSSPPEGDWICPACIKKQNNNQKHKLKPGIGT